MFDAIHTTERGYGFIKTSFEFLKQLASELNAASVESRLESAQKIVKNEIAGFKPLTKNIFEFRTGCRLIRRRTIRCSHNLIVVHLLGKFSSVIYLSY